MANKLFGDWNKFQHVLYKLSENHDQYEGIIISIGEKITERIWDLIESQSIELEPLVEEYRQRKVREGYDERILIRTGDFLNSIAVTDIRGDGENLTVFIGVEDGVTETGISMKELAGYLEFGTEDMIARQPFFRSWEQIRKEVAREVSGRLKAEIGGDLR
jgi:hypothetical protein